MNRDDVIMVEVVVHHFRPKLVVTYRGVLEKRFGQETVHLRAIPLEVL